MRYYRNRLGLSQPELAVKCQVAGWDISRDTVANIEGGRRWVRDFELQVLSEVLHIPIQDFFPRGRRRV